jgi:hypothetical protein
MENKIKIDLKKKSDSTFKIGDSTVKIKTWLNTEEVAYIVDESCAYFKELIGEDDSDAVILVSTLLKMEMLIVLLATNLDIEDLDANQIGETGLFDAIHSKLFNYGLIKDSVMAGMNMIGNGLIINQMSQIASIEDLSNAENQIKGYMEGENSDKIKELIEVMLANNPTLANALDKSIKTEE